MRNSFDVTRTEFEMIDRCGKAVHEKQLAVSRIRFEDIVCTKE